MKNLTSNLSNYKCLSFDFFDTIARREIDPEQVKKIWCHELIRIYDAKMSAKSLYRRRLQIEEDLCSRSVSEGKDQEFRITDLYDELSELFDANSKVAKSDFLQKCLALELTIEKRYLRLTPVFKQFVKEFRSGAVNSANPNLKIIIISDFYLSREHIQEFLVHLGVRDLFDEIFVSSHTKLKKSSSRFFEYVLAEMAIAAADTLHVGDNQLADIEMAAKVNINSIKVEKDEAFYKDCRKKFGSKTELQNYFRYSNTKNFTGLTLLLYKFCEDLMFHCVRNDVKQLFFLAREGAFLKEVFESYRKTNFPDVDIVSTYIYVSRRSTYLPSLNSLDNGEKFERLLAQYGQNSIRNFLKSLNLNDSDLIAELESINDIDVKHERFVASEAYTDLMANETFVRVYESCRTKQKQELTDYIRACKITEENVIDVVDVGWKGSIQNNLFATFDEKIAFRGHYIGLQKGALTSLVNRKTGYLVDQRKLTREAPQNIFMESTALIESLLSADHGSTSHYLNGTPQLEANKVEESCFDEFISKYQSRAVEEFQTFAQELPKFGLARDDYEECFAKFYTWWICHPSATEVSIFSKLKHYENFGCMDYSDFSPNQTKTAFLKKLIKNPVYAIGSQWWPSVTLLSLDLSFINKFYYIMKHRRLCKYKWNTQKVTGDNGRVSELQSELQNYEKKMQKIVDSQAHLIDQRDKYIKELERKYDECIEAIENQGQMIDERDVYIKQLEERLN